MYKCTTAKKYTDEKTAETLKAAQDYHDEHEEQLREDMDDADRAIRGGFADADRETLQKAKEYADRQDTKKLAEARKYADDMDEETLAAANRYTDNKTEATLFPVPVGTVLMWPATGNIPPDYRLCDGSALLVEEYPELYAVIGAGFNNCKNYNDVNYVTQSGYFRIPDLRGRFVVGHNAEAGEYSTCGNAGGRKVSQTYGRRDAVAFARAVPPAQRQALYRGRQGRRT